MLHFPPSIVGADRRRPAPWTPAPRWALLVIAWAIVLAGPLAAQQGAEGRREMPPGFDPDRHMAVAEVRPGMAGYGKTVFQGVEIETFKVEVVSVEQGFEPGKAVVWVRCPDPRMQKTGPVSGMSGSPIYLYPNGVDATRADPSRARMLGAFAFGFGMGKDCYVGVQPIEQMLEASARADFDRDDRGKGEAGADDRADDRVDEEAQAAGEGEAGAGGGRMRAMAAALHAAEALELDDRWTWRMKALAKLTGAKPMKAGSPKRFEIEGARRTNELRTPFRVGSKELAAMMEPMFAGSRLRPLAGGSNGSTAGMPPNWINPHAVKMEPGSVLSVPLVSGDLDWAAVGTVTEVLPDGTVLGFGHAMDGVGKVNLPMATGFVHFIQPSISSSFKLGGSLRVVGALGNDEMAAVVGSSKLTHRYREAKVRVEWPDESKSKTYTYRLAEDRFYTPLLAGYTAAASVASDTTPDDRKSIEVESRVRFEDGRELSLRGLAPQGGAGAAGFTIIPPLSTLRDSPFGELKLDSIDTTIRVIDEVKSASIINAHVRQTKLAPGESVKVFAQLKPHQDKPFTRELTIDVPEDLPDGDYAVLIASAQEYLYQRMETRPHLSRVTDMDELFDMVEYISTLRDDALYVSLYNTQRPQAAVGRTELPDLPTSKLAILLEPTSSRATAYVDSVDEVKPMDYVVRGSYSFPISVQSKPEAGQ